MGIKKSVQIAAETLNAKASRLQAMATMQQAERLLREDETRPATHKAKRGKQAIAGRVRVERSRPAVVTTKHILELEGMLADMAVAETLKDERGYAYSVSPKVGLRWVHPAKLVVGTTGFYSNATCWFVPTIEGLMAFEDELIDQHALPREYVTPEEVIAVTGRRLGK